MIEGCGRLRVAGGECGFVVFLSGDICAAQSILLE